MISALLVFYTIYPYKELFIVQPLFNGVFFCTLSRCIQAYNSFKNKMRIFDYMFFYIIFFTWPNLFSSLESCLIISVATLFHHPKFSPSLIKHTFFTPSPLTRSTHLDSQYVFWYLYYYVRLIAVRYQTLSKYYLCTLIYQPLYSYLYICC